MPLCACGCGKEVTGHWREPSRINKGKWIQAKYINGHNKKVSLKGITNPYYGKHHSKLIREKISKNHADFNGIKNPSYGKPPKWYKIKYNNMQFRSSWEVEYVKLFDVHGILWLYEPKTFNLGNTTYTPDFYFPVQDKWLEIKGWEKNNKFQIWVINNPNIKALKIKGISEQDKQSVLNFLKN